MDKNKILQSLFARLPGGHLFNNGLLVFFKNVITFKLSIEDWYILRMYFIGTKRINNSYKNYLKYLEEKYWDKENNLFDFKITKIKKPSGYEEFKKELKGPYAAFWGEFFDILYPEIFRRNSIFTYEGSYFYKEVRVTKGDIVIDGGANLGMFSALAASCGAEKVYAFEPVKDTIGKNLIEIKSNLFSNIEIIPLALSDKKEKKIIEIPLFEEIASSLFKTSFIKDIEKRGETIKQEEIETISLDEWVKENKISRIDFIKADIEGAERLLLKGAQQVLKEFAPKLSICTYHFKDDKKVLPQLILEANPHYKIYLKYKKLYAFVK